MFSGSLFIVDSPYFNEKSHIFTSNSITGPSNEPRQMVHPQCQQHRNHSPSLHRQQVNHPDHSSGHSATQSLPKMRCWENNMYSPNNTPEQELLPSSRRRINEAALAPQPLCGAGRVSRCTPTPSRRVW